MNWIPAINKKNIPEIIFSFGNFGLPYFISKREPTTPIVNVKIDALALKHIYNKSVIIK